MKKQRKHYAPLPVPVARRLWIVELAGSAAIGAVLWLAGRFLEPKGGWHGV